MHSFHKIIIGIILGTATNGILYASQINTSNESNTKKTARHVRHYSVTSLTGANLTAGPHYNQQNSQKPNQNKNNLSKQPTIQTNLTNTNQQLSSSHTSPHLSSPLQSIEHTSDNGQNAASPLLNENLSPVSVIQNNDDNHEITDDSPPTPNSIFSFGDSFNQTIKFNGTNDKGDKHNQNDPFETSSPATPQKRKLSTFQISSNNNLKKSTSSDSIISLSNDGAYNLVQHQINDMRHVQNTLTIALSSFKETADIMEERMFTLSQAINLLSTPSSNQNTSSAELQEKFQENLKSLKEEINFHNNLIKTLSVTITTQIPSNLRDTLSSITPMFTKVESTLTNLSKNILHKNPSSFQYGQQHENEQSQSNVSKVVQEMFKEIQSSFVTIFNQIKAQSQLIKDQSQLSIEINQKLNAKLTALEKNQPSAEPLSKQTNLDDQKRASDSSLNSTDLKELQNKVDQLTQQFNQNFDTLLKKIEEARTSNTILQAYFKGQLDSHSKTILEELANNKIQLNNLINTNKELFTQLKDIQAKLPAEISQNIFDTLNQLKKQLVEKISEMQTEKKRTIDTSQAIATPSNASRLNARGVIIFTALNGCLVGIFIIAIICYYKMQEILKTQQHILEIALAQQGMITDSSARIQALTLAQQTLAAHVPQTSGNTVQEAPVKHQHPQTPAPTTDPEPTPSTPPVLPSAAPEPTASADEKIHLTAAGRPDVTKMSRAQFLAYLELVCSDCRNPLMEEFRLAQGQAT